MNSVERVMAALNHQIPDKVPYAYGYIHPKVREAILGEKIPSRGYKVNWSPVFAPGEKCRDLNPDESTDVRVARKLGLDALGFQLLTPMTPLLESKPDGTYGIKGGLLRPDNLAEFKKGMPDVDDETLYAEAEDFVKRYKGEFALFCRIRLGFSPTLTSIGQKDCISLVKTAPDFVKEVVEFYCGWMEGHIKNLMELGFDFLWDFDDMADKDGPFFTSEELQDVFLPHMKKATEKITIPWIFHSDGDLFDVIDDLMTLGMNGLHPLEPGVMDLKRLKGEYGQKLCLVGNIDMKHIMTSASEDEIEDYIVGCMETMGGSGGYIISDSNQVPASASAENIMKISDSVHRNRKIY